MKHNYVLTIIILWLLIVLIANCIIILLTPSFMFIANVIGLILTGVVLILVNHFIEIGRL